ncbi:receptor-type tyrosine-protein phosphatase eta-like [Ambystoma mexicanum]|uniref:receptor-type tyrosine-protein phosphatase eta-like n=1 Tax=Ambystoma mexicanum TaxID=8296 RepID=UPI0037E6F93C
MHLLPTCWDKLPVPNITNNLSVSEIHIDSVSLTWLPPTGNKSSYLVEVSGEPSSSAMVYNESVSIFDLVPGNFYTFYVSAVSGDGTLHGNRSRVFTHTVPGVITNLHISTAFNDSVSLSWLPPYGNKGSYLVQVLGNPASSVTVYNESVTIDKLITGNRYVFSISAISDDGSLQGKSTSLSCIVGILSILSISNITMDSVSLNWYPSTDNQSSYSIEVAGDPASRILVNNVSVTILDLVPGNFYTFYVSTVPEDGALQETLNISSYTVPNVTNHLIVSDVSIDSVSLSWLPPTGNRSSYLVKASGDPASSVMVYNESVSIYNLIPGNLYTFYVSAQAGNIPLEGESSVIATYTVPNVTNHLIVSDVSIDSVSLSWLAPTGNRSSYLIQVLGNPSRNVTVFSEVASINNLIPGNLYTFLVSAVSGDGSSGESTSISTWTEPNVTNNLIVSDVTMESVSLSWLPPTGNRSSYLVQVLGNPARNETVFTEYISITNLIPGNPYIFLVSAVAGDGSSGKSMAISAWTEVNVTKGLNVSDVSIDSVSLSWLPSSGNRSSYLIQVLGNPSRNVTVFTEVASIKNLIPGNPYTFLVSAVSGDGTLGESTSISTWTGQCFQFRIERY